MVKELIGDNMLKEWKVIDNFPDYAVNNYGEVKRIMPARRSRVGRMLKPYIMKDGYYLFRLKLNRKTHYKLAHHLVLETFKCKRPEGKECNHIDGDKSNNNITNLEWVTRSYNLKHAFKLGLRNVKGEKHPRNKLTEDDIYFIRELYSDGNFFQRDIAEMVGCTQDHISKIVTQKVWTHI